MGDSACCICLSELKQDQAVMLCPEGHATCAEDLQGLLGFLSSPDQLRRHKGMIPCPWVGDEGLCGHKWGYREVDGLLGEAARLQYTESVLGLMSLLLERGGGGGGGRAGDGGAAVASRGGGAAADAGLVLDLIEEGGDVEVEEVVAEVMSKILNLRCPCCHAVFLDFEACCAVTCATCGVCFCALCLDESAAGDGADTHVHLVAKHGDLFFSPTEVLAQQNAYRSDHLVTYLKALGRDQRPLVYQVLDRLRPACSDLSLDLEPIYDELRTFYEGPRGLKGDEEDAPAVVVASAAALVRRRSTEELMIEDILGTVGRFDPGDAVRILDTMGVLLGRGKAYATCTGSRLIPGLDDEDLVLVEVHHLGPVAGKGSPMIMPSPAAGAAAVVAGASGRMYHVPPRKRNVPRHLPPLLDQSLITDETAAGAMAGAAAMTASAPPPSPPALNKSRRPPSLSLDLLAPRFSFSPAPVVPSPPWTFGEEDESTRRIEGGRTRARSDSCASSSSSCGGTYIHSASSRASHAHGYSRGLLAPVPPLMGRGGGGGGGGAATLMSQRPHVGFPAALGAVSAGGPQAFPFSPFEERRGTTTTTMMDKPSSTRRREVASALEADDEGQQEDEEEATVLQSGIDRPHGHQRHRHPRHARPCDLESSWQTLPLDLGPSYETATTAAAGSSGNSGSANSSSTSSSPDGGYLLESASLSSSAGRLVPMPESRDDKAATESRGRKSGHPSFFA